MKDTYEHDITENLDNHRNLVLLGVRADADIKDRNLRIRELLGHLSNGRNFLMEADPESLSIADIFEAFGFGRDGSRIV